MLLSSQVASKDETGAEKSLELLVANYNDPNDWAAEIGDPRYIVDLLRRVVTVSIETMKIVLALPVLEL